MKNTLVKSYINNVKNYWRRLVIFFTPGDFLRAWALLLEYIESSALCQNAEVSLAALKSFHEILNIPTGEETSEQIKSSSSSDEFKMLFATRSRAATDSVATNSNPDAVVDETALWSNAWRIWRNIGTAVTTLPDTAAGAAPTSYIPSQSFLTTLIATFPPLFTHIRSQFVSAELQRLFAILQRALSVPVSSSSMSFFLLPVSSNSESPALTPLHDSVLNAIKVIIKVSLLSMDDRVFTNCFAYDFIDIMVIWSRINTCKYCGSTLAHFSG